MDPITAATSVGTDDKLQAHLAKMEAEALSADEAQVDEIQLARHTRVKALQAEISGLQERLDGIKARLARTQRQAVNVVKSGAEWADASAHQQLGSYPWAKLAGASAATFIGTRLLRALPLGGIASIAIPLIVSQIKARNTR